jgi:hypothetical protein
VYAGSDFNDGYHLATICSNMLQKYQSLMPPLKRYRVQGTLMGPPPVPVFVVASKQSQHAEAACDTAVGPISGSGKCGAGGATDLLKAFSRMCLPYGEK